MKAVIVYAYGEDPYMQAKHQELMGVFTSTRQMIAALRADGLTKRQYSDRLKGHEYDWQLNVGIQIEYDKGRGDKSAYRLESIRLNQKI